MHPPILADGAEPDANLVGWWGLDEGGGTVVHDLSGHGHDGRLEGGPAWVDGHGGGRALSFDGEDDLVVLPDLGTVEQYPFSFTAWIRTSCREDREMTAVIQEHAANSSRRVQLYLSRRGEPKWNVRNSHPEAEVVDPVDVRDGGWHFLAGVSRARDHHELHVDGAPPLTSTAAVDAPSVNSAAIGNWRGNQSGTKWFEGEIDDVRIYNAALSRADIDQIMGPVPMYPLTVADGTGSGTHAVGSTVHITAGAPPPGQVFAGWSGDALTVRNPTAASTQLIMPGRAASVSANFEECAEVLCNGIRLPQTWPPRRERLTPDPVTPPYLLSPPEVMPIDVGRQLFVDDFLIEETTLSRTYHRPQFYEGNPILEPEEPWEWEGRGPMAIPHSGGVCFDPADGLFPGCSALPQVEPLRSGAVKPAVYLRHLIQQRVGPGWLFCEKARGEEKEQQYCN
ncbi:MAG: LamG-like jellyroll fold domain-containing protein, partial [Armatimonadota bacterium]